MKRVVGAVHGTLEGQTPTRSTPRLQGVSDARYVQFIQLQVDALIELNCQSHA